ncbi:hypothetical protein J4438_01505 [Candidatus Woesearchaeota archaeon]|nr:hypothetical protein [Candidatus Woesearchaeota archaeon]
MPKEKIIDSKEIISLIIGSLVLGFIFSFKEWGYGSVNIDLGLSNLIRATILSLIVLSIYQLSHKLIAKKFELNSRFTIWSMKRFWFTKSSKVNETKLFGMKIKSIKMGVIIPLLFAFLTNGILKFATVGSSEISQRKGRNVGREYKHISEYEEALIFLVGPLTCLLMALIFKQFPGFDKLVEISYTLAIFSMIPFSGLDGSKIFFGSLPLYICSGTFILISVALMQILSPVLTLILSAIVAILLLTIFLYRTL